MNQSKVEIYVAGTTTSQKQGGWCAVLTTVLQEKTYVQKIGGAHSETTPTEMTLLSVICALELLKINRSHYVVIYTSVVQVSKGLNRLMYEWQKQGWTTKKGLPPQHLLLWKRLFELVSDKSFIAHYEVKLINEHQEENRHRQLALHGSNAYRLAGASYVR